MAEDRRKAKNVEKEIRRRGLDGIAFEVVRDGNIEQCRDLCNELMAYQKARAVLAPEAFDAMNFDTRMKRSYEHALDSQVIVAKDGGVPVGYVFSTVERVTEEDMRAVPAWAPAPVDRKESIQGFYPDWIVPPITVGCLSNLYIRDAYRGTGLGSELFDRALSWLESHPAIDDIFIYVSNGNEAALRFYLDRGFTFSHEVFGGFIQAVYRKKPGA